jgi:hypothetical protein
LRRHLSFDVNLDHFGFSFFVFFCNLWQNIYATGGSGFQPRIQLSRLEAAPTAINWKNVAVVLNQINQF